MDIRPLRVKKMSINKAVAKAPRKEKVNNMKYRVSRKENQIPTKEFTSKKEATAYAKSFRIKSGVPVPTIEKINNDGEVVGAINLEGKDIHDFGTTKTKASQIRAGAKYDKANTKGIYLKLNINTDADIIKKLEESGNVQGYIKELIRKDLSK